MLCASATEWQWRRCWFVCCRPWRGVNWNQMELFTVQWIRRTENNVNVWRLSVVGFSSEYNIIIFSSSYSWFNQTLAAFYGRRIACLTSETCSNEFQVLCQGRSSGSLFLFACLFLVCSEWKERERAVRGRGGQMKRVEELRRAELKSHRIGLIGKESR